MIATPAGMGAAAKRMFAFELQQSGKGSAASNQNVSLLTETLALSLWIREIVEQSSAKTEFVCGAISSP